MITFKPVIKKDHIRADKTWLVLIRLCYNRIVRYVPTSIYVERKDLTSTYKIKNQIVLDKCEAIIRMYRSRIISLNLEFNDVGIDAIVAILKQKEVKNYIDFFEFADKWIEKQSLKGVKNYKTAINSFRSFIGCNILPCDEITTNLMKSYEEYLKDKPRAMSLYTSSIQHIFNEAMQFYNDEDKNILKIKNTLSRYTPPKQNIAQKRALTVEQIVAIMNLPYNENLTQSRFNIAKDCLILSLFLMGMNSVDMYNAKEFDGEYITYYRTKTKDRRADGAKMVIRVHPFLIPIINKYKGKERVFDFYERYYDAEALNKAINKGLKIIKDKVGIDTLQFYSVRHTFATIAWNKLKIDKSLVNEMLCHIDTSMRVTDLYIQKDYTPMNEANFKFIEYILSQLNTTTNK